LRLSRANLIVAEIASADKTEPAIHRLHVEADGSTAAAGTAARAVMVVSPVDPPRAAQFPAVEVEEAAPGPGGVGVSLPVARKARMSIPLEKRDALHYVQITRCDEREIEMMATDGQQKWKTAGAPMRGRFPRWREAVARARSRARTRVCFDARVLMQALAAFLKACPDRGNRNPVFMEVGDSHDPILLRGLSQESNQSVVALVKPLNTDGYWLPESDWERGVGGVGGVEIIKRERKSGGSTAC
jgi:hypothetical protein